MGQWIVTDSFLITIPYKIFIAHLYISIGYRPITISIYNTISKSSNKIRQVATLLSIWSILVVILPGVGWIELLFQIQIVVFSYQFLFSTNLREKFERSSWFVRSSLTLISHFRMIFLFSRSRSFGFLVRI